MEKGKRLLSFSPAYYARMIRFLKDKGYRFAPFRDLSGSVGKRMVVLRHDVDRCPRNALRIAGLEKELGVRSTFFLRVVNGGFDETVIRAIGEMGHETGYHYEDLALARGDIDRAIRLFEMHLGELRKIREVKSICMHGSPLSRFDNLKLWDHYDYRDYGITCEPYLDIDYNEFFYITDTGRNWNNTESNIRDKVSTGFDIKIRDSKHFLDLIEKDILPDKLIINTHPHRWFPFGVLWFRELSFQNLKNLIKKAIFPKSLWILTR